MTQVILITGGKGGVGKTAVCAGLAEALARAGKAVLLMEGSTRALDVRFGVSDEVVYDLSDAVEGRCALSDAMLEAGGAGRLYLICAPLEGRVAFDAQLCRELAASAEGRFDFLLVEADGCDRETLRAFCAAADRAVIVSTADRVSARASRAVSDLLAAEGLEDLRLCINMLPEDFLRERQVPDLDWVIDNVCAQLIAVLPYDRVLGRGMTTGHSINLSNVSKMIFDNFAQRILGNYIDLLIG